MPRNGSGDYSLPTNSWNPAINGVSATPADWQALIDDVKSAIQGSLAADGQTSMTGDLAMGGYRLTGAGAPSGAGMSLRWEQLIQGADIPSASAITIPLEGQSFVVTGSTAITSIAATIAGRLIYLKFDAGIVLTNSSNLILPDGVNITTAADDVAVFLSLGSGVWRCVSYPMAASETIKGRIQIATTTQVRAFLDDLAALTSKKLKDAFTGSGIYVDSANGFQKLPSGYTLKNQQVVVPGNTTTNFSFTTAFLNNCRGVVVCPISSGLSASSSPMFGAAVVSNAAFSVQSLYTSGNVTCQIFAWGS